MNFCINCINHQKLVNAVEREDRHVCRIVAKEIYDYVLGTCRLEYPHDLDCYDLNKDGKCKDYKPYGDPEDHDF